MSVRHAITVLLLAAAIDAMGAVADKSPDRKTDKLPATWGEGLAAGINPGIAAKYPDAAGLAKDPDVYAVEDFESGRIQLPYTEGDRWDAMMKVTKTSPLAGSFSGEVTWAQGDNGGANRYWFPKKAHEGAHPAYFIRAYRKFDHGFFPGDVSKKVGLKGMGICCLAAKFDGRGGAKAGGACDGTNWYTVEDQFVGYAGKGEGSQNGYDWFAHLYSYEPFPKESLAKVGELKINDPPATRWSCYAQPKRMIAYDVWNCYEVGLYLNTPGTHDGEARYWINGELQARVTGICFRTVAAALPEIATLNLYRTTEDFPQKMTMWIDDIVIARRYIGPLKPADAKAKKTAK
ncbi:MAG: hypothetical protein H0W83_00835 [Planctomycetes bacterium]|nr:hypothetical protein [Planctomycetota bacterium]